MIKFGKLCGNAKTMRCVSWNVYNRLHIDLDMFQESNEHQTCDSFTLIWNKSVQSTRLCGTITLTPNDFAFLDTFEKVDDKSLYVRYFS